MIPELREVSALPANWDGDGSPAPSPAIVSAADALLNHLLDFDAPFVVPVSGGGLQLEWSVGGKHLELAFIDSETVIFLTETPPTPYSWSVMHTGHYSTGDHVKTQELLDWLRKD